MRYWEASLIQPNVNKISTILPQCVTHTCDIVRLICHQSPKIGLMKGLFFRYDKLQHFLLVLHACKNVRQLEHLIWFKLSSSVSFFTITLKADFRVYTKCKQCKNKQKKREHRVCMLKDVDERNQRKMNRLL